MERRLSRSLDNRVFLGVCGGFGEYFNIDPVLIRVIAVIITIATGFFPGLIAYFIIALIIPVEGSITSRPEDTFRENISDMKNTTSNLGQEIRNSFENQGTSSDTGEKTSSAPPPSQPRRNTNSALLILGLIIIAIGVFFILVNIFGWLWRYTWPVLLIVAGIIIIIAVLRRR